MTESFPALVKEIDMQVQEVRGVPDGPSPGHDIWRSTVELKEGKVDYESSPWISWRRPQDGLALYLVLKNVLCGYPASVLNLIMSDTPKKRKSIWLKIARYDWPPNWPVVEDTRPSAPLIIEMSNLSFQSAHTKPTAPLAFCAVTPRARSVPLPTWDQLKKLAQVAEHRLSEEKIPKTEANMLLSMMAVLAISSDVDNKPSDGP
ncbi:PREDICTED: uncharacterized protein LOC109371797 [Hipposideros armiger]|uniref:Uncharacterized protein LOC109371797 n=1 Tax=Hipposideros armiger TaxID=186990 RepID=A0A8B7PUF6_HIPAR|nr:PREDICTED: uncharacterized protein LOC109371797 [Hipposideros armiger]